jgi:O-succinylbenzoate synthase
MRIDAIILRELHMPLVRPFETSFGVTRNRRYLLAEVQSEGLTGWGECTAGERPIFSSESTDSAWQVIVNELGTHAGRRVAGARRRVPAHLRSGARQSAWPRRRSKTPSGILKRSAKASRFPTARRRARDHSLRRFAGHSAIDSELLAIIERELAAGYQRIKLKCKPGWDVEVLRARAQPLARDSAQLRRQLRLPLRDADHLVNPSTPSTCS